LIAASSDPLSDQSAAAGGDCHLCADGVAIGDCTLELERQEVIAPCPVVEVRQRPFLGEEHGVDTAVVIQVA
jgi:hypothetical protein